MWIPNRNYRRNLVLYGILYASLSGFLIATLIWVPSTMFMTVLFVSVWAILLSLIARSMLRMPSGIELGKRDLKAVLIWKAYEIPFDSVLKLSYDVKDCRMMIITVKRRIDLVDLSVGPEDLERMEGIGRSRGWVLGENRGR